MEPAKEPVLIFVVDDDPLVRDLLARQLSGYGATVATFERGEQCLAAMAGRKPDLVFIDLLLPGRPGDEICRIIKEDPELGGIAVVIFTGADAAHEVMRSWRAGADDFLPKPIRGKQLLSKIEAVRGGAANGRAPAPSPDAPRILFVDDSRFFRNVLGGALEHSGFHVLYARSGTEALALADLNPGAIDGVISDLVMPGLDGLSLLRALRQRPTFADRPFLLLSGSAPTAQQAQEVRQLSGHPVLEKRDLPVEAILGRINAALRRVAADLRAAERVPFFSVVEFRRADDPEWLSGFSYDVSAGGLFVRSMTPLPVRSSVELRVKFTFRQSPKTASGLVVWSNEYRARTSWCYPVGMGVRFTWLDVEDSEAVARLVKVGVRAA